MEFAKYPKFFITRFKSLLGGVDKSSETAMNM
jgi:hypothetical protein